ncbi:MAG: DUF4893 domain-containing protein [Pseudomonadota bacterium]|nr:DUF4893 domain-containing protein [Pseudomonadota bacterium]
MLRLFLTALLFFSASGCATSPTTPGQADWRGIATSADRERLRGWRSAFSRGLDRARAAGHGADIAREGRLLDPDAAIPGAIPNGRYRCRIIKLGAKSEGLLDYVAYPPFACVVQQQGALQGFAKLDGSQRQVGLIYRGDALRQPFLGTLVLGDESRALRYGTDAERDTVGWVERIEPRRWRMVLPSPAFESLTDVLELVPEG